MGDTQEQIRDLIRREVAADPAAVLDADTPLIAEGIIDSLGIIQLVKALEEHFSIIIEVEDVVEDNFATIRAVDALVTSKLGPQTEG